jgi:hypothetical protein
MVESKLSAVSCRYNSNIRRVSGYYTKGLYRILEIYGPSRFLHPAVSNKAFGRTLTPELYPRRIVELRERLFESLSKSKATLDRFIKEKSIDLNIGFLGPEKV